MKDILGLMMLSWPLVLLVLIVLSMLIAVPLAIRYARKSGRNKWAWGIGVFLLIFLPVFWDWIPTVLMHKYYCSTEAGFWVYKTVDQWKAENPGGMDVLEAKQYPPQTQERLEGRKGLIDSYQLNDRFNWIVIKQDVSSLLQVMRQEQQVKDMKTGEVLARYVDFSTGYSSTPDIYEIPKFWLQNGNCSGGGRNQDALRTFRNHIMGANK